MFPYTSLYYDKQPFQKKKKKEKEKRGNRGGSDFKAHILNE